MSRLAPLLLVSFLISDSSFASAKRRAVNVPFVAEATLTANIADAATGNPVLFVEVAGPGVFTRSDRAGNFSVRLPLGHPVALTFTRSGYEPLTEIVTIHSNTTDTIRLQSRPSVRIRTRAGVTYEVDLETLEFGYPEFFLGYRRDRKVAMCKQGGGELTLDRDDARRLRGPAFSAIELRCCPRGTPTGLEVELKSGETHRAYFLDSCEGRTVELIANDHVTYEPVFVRVTDVAEVVFP